MISVQNVFDFRTNKFSEHYLRKFIEKFLCKYPDDCLLGQAICFMLETNDDLRPDFVTLRNRMPDFKEVDLYFAAFDGPSRIAHSIPSRPSIFNNRMSQAPPITESERNSYLKYFLDKKETDPFEPDQQQDGQRYMFDNPFTFVGKPEHSAKNPLHLPQQLETDPLSNQHLNPSKFARKPADFR